MVRIPDQNYIMSNKLTLPAEQTEQLPQAKTLYRLYREVSEINQNQLQTLSNAILALYGLRPILVVFDGIQPHKDNKQGSLRRKTMGQYKPDPFVHDGQVIKVYKYTAKQHKVYAPKSAIATLVHEIVHHLDSVLLHIRSVHSAGFYIRISHIENLLK